MSNRLSSGECSALPVSDLQFMAVVFAPQLYSITTNNTMISKKPTNTNIYIWHRMPTYALVKQINADWNTPKNTFNESIEEKS